MHHQGLSALVEAGSAHEYHGVASAPAHPRGCIQFTQGIQQLGRLLRRDLPMLDQTQNAVALILFLVHGLRPLQHLHRLFHRDLLRGQPIQHSAPVNAPIILRRSPQRRDNLVQTATRSVIGDVQFSRQLLNVAAILDHQLHKVKLLTAQAANPAQAKAALDHNPTRRAFQPRYNQFLATDRVSRNQWIHTSLLHSTFLHFKGTVALRITCSSERTGSTCCRRVPNATRTKPSNATTWRTSLSRRSASAAASRASRCCSRSVSNACCCCFNTSSRKKRCGPIVISFLVQTACPFLLISLRNFSIYLLNFINRMVIIAYQFEKCKLFGKKNYQDGDFYQLQSGA